MQKMQEALESRLDLVERDRQNMISSRSGSGLQMCWLDLCFKLTFQQFKWIDSFIHSKNINKTNEFDQSSGEDEAANGIKNLKTN